MEVDMKELKEAIKALNETGELDPKIKIVGTKKEVLVELFTEAVEMLEKEERDIPDKAVLLYNVLYNEEEGEETEPEIEPKKETPKKKAAPKKKEKAKEKKETPKKKAPEKKEKKSTAKKDDFGFTIGSQKNLFVKAIKKKAMTMADVKELDWNEKHSTFYDVFKGLVERNLAEKDEKTNKMKIKK